MNVLNRAAIIAANDIVKVPVDMPEWGGTVFVQTLRSYEKDAFETSCLVRRKGRREFNGENVRARLGILCLVDEAGQRLFTDDDDDILGSKSSKAISRIYALAQELNGISDDDIEELAKNSKGGREDSSRTASPSPSAE